MVSQLVGDNLCAIVDAMAVASITVCWSISVLGNALAPLLVPWFRPCGHLP